jgi:hypothetical protein
MYFWGLRGGSTGSLLCNAIMEGNVLSGAQRRKRRQLTLKLEAEEKKKKEIRIYPE